MNAAYATALPPNWPSRVLVLAGPTATGKSELALLLAQRLDAEIVAVDSVQVYRGLDLGSAKPSLADRARVPHHLLDVLEPSQPFDAAQFIRLARAAVADILARGRLPVLCGGAGLYFKALFEGLGEAPPADAALRAQLEATPLPDLLRELAERDPAAFAQLDRNNPRRVIRALEVIRLTGKPFSAQRAAWTRAAPAGTGLAPVSSGTGLAAVVPGQDAQTTEERPTAGGRELQADTQDRPAPSGTELQTGTAQAAGRRLKAELPTATAQATFYGLDRSSADLRRRIEARTEEMFRRGLVAETQALLARGLSANPTASQALGYRQALEHLQGLRSLPDTIALVKIRTWQFAKRQRTWFRRQFALRWIRPGPEAPLAVIADRLAHEWAQRRAVC